MSPVNIDPPPGGAAAAAYVATEGHLTVLPATGTKNLAVDSSGVDPNAQLQMPTATFTSALSGVAFSVWILNSSGDRLGFDVQPAGTNWWKPALAMEVGSGYWDYQHRGYDTGQLYQFLVPAYGLAGARIVRLAGTAGANTCAVTAAATHVAFPPPPQFAGKRDVVMMVRTQLIASDSAYHLLLFDWSQSNDDRTRTLTSGINTHPVTTGKRLFIQGYDLAYKPGATAGDYIVANVVARANGAVSTNEANSPPILELDLFSAPGRPMVLPEPIELQNALGVGQGSIGIKAKGQPGGGVLGGTVFGFETL